MASLLTIGDIVITKVPRVVLWTMDEEFHPSVSKGEVNKDELLIVLQTYKLQGERIVPRWRTAVKVLSSNGGEGWVGAGWLHKPKRRLTKDDQKH